MFRQCLTSVTAFFFLWAFVCIGTDLQAQSMDCKRFKNGSFKIVDAQAGTSFITRKGNKQTEFDEARTNIMELTVKWIDDCTYELRPTKKTRKNYPFFPENAVITSKIIEVKSNSYVMVATTNFTDGENTCEVHID